MEVVGSLYVPLIANAVSQDAVFDDGIVRLVPLDDSAPHAFSCADQKKGMPYQTLMRILIVEGLEKLRKTA